MSSRQLDAAVSVATELFPRAIPPQQQENTSRHLSPNYFRQVPKALVHASCSHHVLARTSVCIKATCHPPALMLNARNCLQVSHMQLQLKEDVIMWVGSNERS